MSDLASPSDPFRLASTPRRRRILEGLRFLGGGPEGFYLDALRIMSEPETLYTASHLVGHCFREIESAVREAFLPIDYISPSGTEGRNAHSVKAVLGELGIGEDEPLGKQWLWVAKEGVLHKRAHRRNLLPAPRLDSAALQTVEEFESLLDGVLAASEARYTQLLPTLETMASRTAPTGADLDFVKRTMPRNPVTLGHFFGALHHPGWLVKLDELGMFAHPRDLVPADEEKVRVSPWPEGRYLAEMAAIEPAKVLEITSKVPGSDNPRVYEGISDVAIALPANEAAQLVPMLVDGLALRFQLLLPDKVADVVVHLANAGYSREALELTAQLLRILPAPNETAVSTGLSSARSIMNEWNYGQLLTKVQPSLVEADGIGTLQLLIGLLETAVERSRPMSSQADRDYSEMWRSEVSSEQDEHMDIPNILVSAVARAARGLVSGEPEAASKVAAELDAPRFPVFRRILLEVARDQTDDRLAGELLSREPLFEAWSPEYQKLLRSCFPGLPAAIRDSVLTWVERGPSLDLLRRWLRGPGDADPSPDVVEEAMEDWRRGRLAEIGSPVPPRWLDRLGHLAPPQPPPQLVFGSRRMVMTGDGSQAEAIDLAHLDRAGLVSYTRTLASTDQWSGRLADVSAAITRQVGADPTWPGELDDDFAEVPPSLIDALITGYSVAYDQGKEMPWEQILRSCAWVLHGPHDLAPGARPVEATEFSRKSILWLLEKAFKDPNRTIPEDQAANAWAIVSPLVGDVGNASVDDSLSDTDYPVGTASLNSLRAVAVTTAIEYSRWLRRQSPDAAAITTLPPGVAAFLESQLDPDNPSGQAVRESFGRFFPILWQLDAKWTRERVDQIFDDSDAGAAAWRVFLAFWRPFGEIFPHVRHLYERSIDALPQSESGSTDRQDRGRDLAEHIIVYRAWLGVEQQDGNLVDRFFGVASAQLRRHALEYPAFVLARSADGDDPPSGTIERLQRVWEAREQRCAGGDAADAAEEMRAFGYWFTSRALPLDWSMEHLDRAVEIGGRIDNEHDVVERVAGIDDEYLGIAIRVLGRMTATDDDQWGVLQWADGCHALLKRGRASVDPQVRTDATRIIGRLLQRGYDNFKDLVSQEVNRLPA